MNRIRVLHVLQALSRGGVETWLFHLAKHFDRSRFQLDFLVSAPGAYDEALRNLGARIHYGPNIRSPVAFARFVNRLLKEQQYQVVHSHTFFSSGFVLSLARAAGVPVRVAHSHNQGALVAPYRILRRAYMRAMQAAIHSNASLGLAASQEAGRSLFGKHWRTDSRWKTLYCSIDLSPFKLASSKIADALRAEFGIPQRVPVIGNVGRMVAAKNQSFLLDVFAALKSRGSAAHLVLVGDGPLRARLERQSTALGLSERVHFVGTRGDVAAMMRNLFSLLLMPSLNEGLPLVGLEAQAAGTPLVVSDSVTKELTVVDSLVTRVPLAASPDAWANAVSDILHSPPHIERDAALSLVALSPFNIEVGAQLLQSEYEHALNRYSGTPGVP